MGEIEVNEHQDHRYGKFDNNDGTSVSMSNFVGYKSASLED